MRAAVNLRLYSSEQSVPTCSNGLPLMSVSVYLSSPPQNGKAFPCAAFHAGRGTMPPLRLSFSRTIFPPCASSTFPLSPRRTSAAFSVFGYSRFYVSVPLHPIFGRLPPKHSLNTLRRIYTPSPMPITYIPGRYIMRVRHQSTLQPHRLFYVPYRTQPEAPRETLYRGIPACLPQKILPRHIWNNP